MLSDDLYTTDEVRAVFDLAKREDIGITFVMLLEAMIMAAAQLGHSKETAITIVTMAIQSYPDWEGAQEGKFSGDKELDLKALDITELDKLVS